MNQTDPISEFLSQLRTELHLGSRLSERVIAEAEDHLLESAQRLYIAGLSSEEAVREAIAHFGTPEEIAKCFRTELKKEGVMQSMITNRPTGIKVLAILVLLCAGFQLVTASNLALWGRELAAALTLGQSLLTWTIGFGLWRLRTWSRIATLLWMGLGLPWAFVLLLLSNSVPALAFDRITFAVFVAPIFGCLGLSVSVVWYLYRDAFNRALDG